MSLYFLLLADLFDLIELLLDQVILEVLDSLEGLAVGLLLLGERGGVLVTGVFGGVLLEFERELFQLFGQVFLAADSL